MTENVIAVTIGIGTESTTLHSKYPMDNYASGEEYWVACKGCDMSNQGFLPVHVSGCPVGEQEARATAGLGANETGDNLPSGPNLSLTPPNAHEAAVGALNVALRTDWGAIVRELQELGDAARELAELIDGVVAHLIAGRAAIEAAYHLEGKGKA